jgi:hypothetical protein
MHRADAVRSTPGDSAGSNDFKPERFVLPKNGLDLRKEMATLRALADGDDPFEEYDVDPDDGPMLDLPRPLVEAVLALDPMQRASLAALIARSLAIETEVGAMCGAAMLAGRSRCVQADQNDPTSNPTSSATACNVLGRRGTAKWRD